MSLRVYNTLTRQKELFEPVHPGRVGMYLCGPTVYKSPHIGHMVGPVIFDAIRRYLVFKGYEVTWVVNITDVDDKLIEAAARAGTTVAALAERHTAEYMECLSLLGIEGINHFPKASEHIAEIISICRTLIEKGHAYAAEGNVYFAVATYSGYGKLSGRDPRQQEAGTRDLEGAGKRHPADFALWKAAKPGEPSWDSPWGPGRPGWHIECSAMSMKYLGTTFDFHGGGMDLIFPHHENELAQSECASGRPFVKYWLHNGLTRIRTKLPGGQWADEKMSGSLGNVVSARQIIEEHGADVLRYLLLSTHYRSPIEFTDDTISSSKKALSAFTRLFERVERISGQKVTESQPEMDQKASSLSTARTGDFPQIVAGLKMKFLEAMDDDFNTAGAIGAMHEMVGQINAFIERHGVERTRQPEQVAAATAAAVSLRRLGGLLGLFRADSPRHAGRDAILLDKVIGLLAALRAEARKSRNFELADRIRNGLSELGILLEDRHDGTVWRRER